jgi:hypothetical protein
LRVRVQVERELSLDGDGSRDLFQRNGRRSGKHHSRGAATSNLDNGRFRRGQDRFHLRGDGTGDEEFLLSGRFLMVVRTFGRSHPTLGRKGHLAFTVDTGVVSCPLCFCSVMGNSFSKEVEDHVQFLF